MNSLCMQMCNSNLQEQVDACSAISQCKWQAISFPSFSVLSKQQTSPCCQAQNITHLTNKQASTNIGLLMPRSKLVQWPYCSCCRCNIAAYLAVISILTMQCGQQSQACSTHTHFLLLFSFEAISVFFFLNPVLVWYDAIAVAQL